jgi:hypothetical protein
MPLTHEQRLAIANQVYDRAERGEPYLTPRLAAESRRRKEIASRIQQLQQ